LDPPNASKDRAAYELKKKKNPIPGSGWYVQKVETNVGQPLEQGTGAHRLSNRVYPQLLTDSQNFQILGFGM
jgi:hypothetical protein